MIRFGLVLAAVLIAVSGAYADVVLVAQPEPTEGVNRDRLWNPFIGTRPWIEPIGYHVPGRTVAATTTAKTIASSTVIGEEGWYSCTDHDHSNARVIHERRHLHAADHDHQ
jgi:hypothetical protein